MLKKRNIFFCLIIFFLFSCENTQFMFPGEVLPPDDLIKNGTPISNTEEFLDAIETGGSFYLANRIELFEPILISKPISLEGNNFSIMLSSSLNDESFINISGSNITMKNIQFGVEGANKPDVYLMYIGGDSQTSDINLYNVEIVTSCNGLSIENADNVIIDNLQINSAEKTLVSIASSENVEIKNFGGYNTDMNDGRHNIVLIRGIGNDITPSSVKFTSADNIESIMVEAVETNYVTGRENIDKEFEKAGVQNVVEGLDDYAIHYIDEPVNERRGWFYEKEERMGTDVYDLNNPSATSADLLAALEATKTDSGRGFTLINMHKDINLTLDGKPLSIPEGVLLCLYDNKLTIDGYITGNSLINVESNSAIYFGEIEVGTVSNSDREVSLISLAGDGASISNLDITPGKNFIPVTISDVGTIDNRASVYNLHVNGTYAVAPIVISSSYVNLREISADSGSGIFPDKPTVFVKGIGNFLRSDLQIDVHSFTTEEYQIYVEGRGPSYESLEELSNSPAGNYQSCISSIPANGHKLRSQGIDYPEEKTKGWLFFF